MSDRELIAALRRNMVETGSLICLGCGCEHHCGIHGCAIMRDAADALKQLQAQLAEKDRQIGLAVELMKSRCYLESGGICDQMGQPCDGCAGQWRGAQETGKVEHE